MRVVFFVLLRAALSTTSTTLAPINEIPNIGSRKSYYALRSYDVSDSKAEAVIEKFSNPTLDSFTEVDVESKQPKSSKTNSRGNRRKGGKKGDVSLESQDVKIENSSLKRNLDQIAVTAENDGRLVRKVRTQINKEPW